VDWIELTQNRDPLVGCCEHGDEDMLVSEWSVSYTDWGTCGLLWVKLFSFVLVIFHIIHGWIICFQCKFQST